MRKLKQKVQPRTAAKRRGTGSRAWLKTEIELIIRERERLLQTAGAAAALVSAFNLRDFPHEAREPVRRLGVMLESLPDETLTDAIEQVLGMTHARRRLSAAL